MYFTFIGQLIRAPPSLHYLSCPNETCKKKVEEANGAEQTCIKCGMIFTKPKPRLFCRLKFIDETGELDANCSGDQQC